MDFRLKNNASLKLWVSVGLISTILASCSEAVVKDRGQISSTQNGANSDVANSGGLELAQPSLTVAQGLSDAFSFKIEIISVATKSTAYSETVKYEPGKVHRIPRLAMGEYKVILAILRKDERRIYAGEASASVDQNGSGRAHVELRSVDNNELVVTSTIVSDLICALYISKTDSRTELFQGAFSTIHKDLRSCYQFVKANFYSKAECGSPGAKFATAVLIDKAKHRPKMLPFREYSEPESPEKLNFSTEFVTSESCSRFVKDSEDEPTQGSDGSKPQDPKIDPNPSSISLCKASPSNGWQMHYGGIVNAASFIASGDSIESIHVTVARMTGIPKGVLNVEVRSKDLKDVFYSGYISGSQLSDKFLSLPVYFSKTPSLKLIVGQSYAVVFSSKQSDRLSPWVINQTYANVCHATDSYNRISEDFHFVVGFNNKTQTGLSSSVGHLPLNSGATGGQDVPGFSIQHWGPVTQFPIQK